MTAGQPALALGLDLGGSSIKWAVIEAHADGGPRLVDEGIDPLEGSRDVARTIDLIARRYAAAARDHPPLRAVGLGLPGIFDRRSGTPTLLPNFPTAWIGYPLRAEIQSRLDAPLTLVNDAKAFAVAESALGAGMGHRCVAGFVVGTGVGGGLVIDGRLWEGTGTAGEFGHLTVELDGPPCRCGNTGCVEAYAGSDALARRGGRASAEEVFAADAAGDARARSAIDEAVRALGAGMANVTIAAAPDVIVLGGGMLAAGDRILRPLAAEIRTRVTVAPDDRIRVVPARLGRSAGAWGAALIAGATVQKEHMQ